ncbi:hypothetical protein [Helicobacter sp. MIT 14-3879]|uniref:hypothetical protein n=1 Tax=Helicobacter sp. MIT 14-3879 TaxID=2040649 RepID=UPI000E1FA702|nr:hypothetical protein [Helicobacter sp. MIT 14-3879]RDU64671.1 hypothetical protein CQA44_02865 [Helicobacter sp. MIT 14-3879]
MKKFFMWLFAIIVVILLLLFILLFTSFGNSILKPYIQAQIDKYSPIPATLDVFSLRFGSFEVELNALNSINVSSSGTFSLFSQNIDGILNINLKNPSNIKQLEGINLSDNFLIENIIRGKINDFVINTSSNIADGVFKIDTQITSFSPKKIFANISNVKIESLLNIIGQKPYATGVLNIKADIDGDSNMNFTGSADAEVVNGNVSKSLVKKDFKIDIPNTNFITNLNIAFNGKEANHKLSFLSNVGNISSNGSTIINGLKTNSAYRIDIKDLSPLTPFAGIPLRGNFRTNGKIVGNSTWLNIDGVTDFASSDTSYSISLEGYVKPKDALVTIKNLKIEDILYTITQPIYAKALLNAKINLKEISSFISGSYNHNIKGSIQENAIKQNFDLDILNNIPFSHNADIVFNKGIGSIDSSILSDIININISKAILNLDSLHLEAPYDINIKDLKKLAFVTSKELKGSLEAKGKVKYNKLGLLYADMKSDIFSGSFDAKLNRNIIDMNLTNISSLGVLDMLQYPQFFNTDINGNVKYDILTQKGNLELLASNGSFTKNKLMDLLNSTIRFDATKEVYDSIKITGDIDKKIINGNLNMTSNNTSLTSKNAKIDLDRDNINAYLTLKIKNNSLGASISGKVSDPKVSLDTKKLANDLIKNIISNDKVQEQKQKLEEKLDEQKGKINDKINNVISNGLNKLFKK